MITAGDKFPLNESNTEEGCIDVALAKGPGTFRIDGPRAAGIWGKIMGKRDRVSDADGHECPQERNDEDDWSEDEQREANAKIGAMTNEPGTEAPVKFVRRGRGVMKRIIHHVEIPTGGNLCDVQAAV